MIFAVALNAAPLAVIPLGALDHALIALFFILSLVIGLAVSKRGGSGTDEYFASGRALPWWIAGISMVATSFGTDAPLFVTGLVRTEGVWKNWLWWSFLTGHVLAVFCFAGLWRRAGVTTDVELVELRYGGRGAAILRGVKALYSGLVLNGAALVLLMVATKKVGSVVLGVNEIWVLIGCVALTGAYCITSGLWGVVLTDLLQFVVAMAGAIVLAVYAVDAAGGLASLREAAVGALGPGGLSIWPSGSPETFFTEAVAMFLVYVGVVSWTNKNVDGGGVLIQRMAASRSPKDAVYATGLFCILHYGLRTWPWILAALATLVLLPPNGPPHPALAAAAAGWQDDHEASYIVIIALLPAGVRGLVIASLAAAFLSTVDTLINLSAAYLVADGYRRFVKREASEAHYVRVARVAGLLLTVAAAACALFADSIASAFFLLVTFTSGLGVVYIARWLWWRTNAWSEIGAILAATFFGLALTWAQADGPGPGFLAPLHLLLGALVASARGALRLPAGTFGLLAVPCLSLPVWLAFTFLTDPVSRDRLQAFYDRVRPPGLWGPFAAGAGGSPRPHGKLLLGWLAGTLLVLASIAAPGEAFFGTVRAAFGWAVAGGAAAVYLYFAFHRNGWADVT